MLAGFFKEPGPVQGMIVEAAQGGRVANVVQQGRPRQKFSVIQTETGGQIAGKRRAVAHVGKPWQNLGEQTVEPRDVKAARRKTQMVRRGRMHNHISLRIITAVRIRQPG